MPTCDRTHFGSVVNLLVHVPEAMQAARSWGGEGDMTTSCTAQDRLVGVGWLDPNGKASAVGLVHLLRWGTATDAPWEVVGTHDTRLTLTDASYGQHDGVTYDRRRDDHRRGREPAGRRSRAVRDRTGRSLRGRSCRGRGDAVVGKSRLLGLGRCRAHGLGVDRGSPDGSRGARRGPGACRRHTQTGPVATTGATRHACSA